MARNNKGEVVHSPEAQARMAEAQTHHKSKQQRRNEAKERAEVSTYHKSCSHNHTKAGFARCEVGKV